MRSERHRGAGEAWIDCQDGCMDGIGGRPAATRAARSEPPPLQATGAGASGLRRRLRRRQRHRRIHLAGGMAAGVPAATPAPDSGCHLLFRTDRPSRPRQGHHPRAPVSKSAPSPSSSRPGASPAVRDRCRAYPHPNPAGCMGRFGAMGPSAADKWTAAKRRIASPRARLRQTEADNPGAAGTGQMRLLATEPAQAVDSGRVRSYRVYGSYRGVTTDAQ